jgi:hypothetical protein
MSNLHPTYDFSSDGDILSGVTPMSLLYEGPTSWFLPSSDLGGDPLFCGTPPVRTAALSTFPDMVNSLLVLTTRWTAGKLTRSVAG